MDRLKRKLFALSLTCLFSLAITLNSAASDLKPDNRFVAEGDKILVDNQTGLMWATQDNSENITWEEAKSYCEKYNAGGYSDWRLPTLAELNSIFDPNSEKRFKSFEPITLTGCCPWTSNTRRNRAKTLFFMIGEPNTLEKTTSYNMRALPVRKAK